jgi:imidazolonepropionase-like amidohydrolase
MRKRLWIVVVFLLIITPLLLSAEEKFIAIKGGKIHTITKGTIENGIILIKGKKIVAVGENIKVPPGAEVIDATGKVITPGLVDSHSHLGLGPSGGVTEDNEMTDSATPQLRIIDSINPYGEEPDKGCFAKALSEGVTTVICRPGSGNVIGGQAAAVKTSGDTVDEIIRNFPCDMKMAMGRKGGIGGYPMTKMGTAYIIRKYLILGKEHREKIDEYQEKKKKDKKSKPPKRDLKAEAMALVTTGKMPVHIHVVAANDIMTIIRLAEEFGLNDISLGHAEEAYKVADEVARHNIRVVVGPRVIVYDDDNQLVNLTEYLRKTGVEVSIMTDADVVQQEYLRYQAALAVKYGMPYEETLRAITLNPAKLAGVADKVGSLEPEKLADLVIFSGDPFDVLSRAEKVMIEGKIVYQTKQGREK